MRRLLFVASAPLAAVVPAAAQVAAPPAPAKATTPTLAQVGMFICPAKRQPPQQAADEAACTQWAEAQTGLELRAGSVDTQAAAKAAQKDQLP